MSDYRYTTEVVHTLTDADRYEARPASQSFPSDEHEPQRFAGFAEFMPQWAIDRCIAWDEGRRYSLPVWKLTAARAATFIAAPNAAAAYTMAVESGWTRGAGVVRVDRDEEPASAGYISKEPPVARHPLNGEPATQAAIDLEIATADAASLDRRVYRLSAEDGAVTYFPGRDAVDAYRSAAASGWTAGRGKVRVSLHIEAETIAA